MPSVDDILAVILGGGRGSRLDPLTRQRSKPAVPLAGKYRLIDIPISNCINSHIFRIAVLTQFNSVSLHRHLTQTYTFDRFHTGWVQVWAAEQTMAHADWYQGTADAVRKQIFEIKSARAPFVLVLAGDHLYRMDYAAMAAFHWEHEADITVAVQPVPRAEASRYGILKRDARMRISRFAEKPKEPLLLDELISREDEAKPYLGSMGIYLFRTNVLIDLLEKQAFTDFGGELIPHAIQTHAVFGYDFDGYWEDIGTIRSFYETNLALAGRNPPFNFFDQERPIYTHPRFLPGSAVQDSVLDDVLLTEGCRIDHAVIRRSVVGVRMQIQRGAEVVESVLMGSDYYETRPAPGSVPMGIGAGASIHGAIVDKNAHIGEGAVIRPFPPGTEIDGEGWYVRDGVVVIPKNGVIRPGARISPEELRGTL